MILGISAVLVFLDARRAEAALRSAVPTVERVQSAVLAGDAASAAPAIAELQEQTATAVAATDGPHWWIAAHMPFVGESVSAVQTVSRVVDTLATDALPALAKSVEVLDPSVLMPQGGQINTRAFVEAAPDVIAADDAVQDAAAQLAGIDETRVIDRVARPVTELRDMVNSTAGTTSLASRAAQLIPAMLGAYGQRQYVILAQSPAEIRATGGHPGAVLLLTADQGHITLGERISGGTLYSATPVLPLTQEENLLFTDRLVTFGVDATLTPDFPRAAEITRAQWAKRFGGEVDGVLAVDPVALGYMLEATGSVRMDDGTVLTSENAASLLLNGIYIDPTLSQADQDAFFGDAADAVLNALLNNDPNVSKALNALTRAADEGRWLLWSSDPREQSLLSGTAIGGELTGERDGSPVVGVYLNDSSATKMSYYLDYPTSVTRLACLASDVRRLSVAVDISSTAPPESARFPPYMSGGGQITPGHSLTNVLIYSPAGGEIENVTVDGADYPATGLYSHDGMEVAQISVDLGPGESHRLVVELLTAGKGQEGPARLRVTPGSHESVQTVEDAAC